MKPAAKFITPPPPRFRGLISGILLAAIALIAAPPADAQTARTITISASVNGGPACTDCRAGEGDRVDFTVALSGITAGVLWTHPYSPAGTATFGVDYVIPTLGRGNSEFAAEVFTASDLISRIRTLRITDDSAPEPDETITVTMRLNPALTTTTDTVTIIPLTITIRANDQPVFSVAVDDAATTEGDTAVFTVTLGDTAPATGTTATVDWAVSGVSAGDWSTTDAGTLTFTGLGSQAVNIAITDDDDREDAETLTFTLSNASTGSTIGTASATTTIAESDQPSARTLTVTGPATLTETDAGVESGNYTITLTGDAFTAASTTVTWQVATGNAAGQALSADFVAATDRQGTVTFSSSEGNNSTKTFSLTVAGDNLNEADETFTVNVFVAAPMADGGTAYGRDHTTTITDDDTLTATLSGGGDSVAEGAAASLTVTLSGATHTADVVFNYNTDDAAGSLTLAPGTNSGTLTITATDDALSEDAETFTVDTSSLTATTAGMVTIAAPQMFTITADAADDITVTIAAASASANTGGSANFTVAMSNASMAAVTVAYDTSGVVTATGDTLIIPAGQTSGSIAIPIPATAVAEGEEGMLTVMLTGVTVASGGGTAMLGTATSATVAVTSDDADERAARLEAPLAIAGRGIGQLAVQAIQQRLRAGVGGPGRHANSLTVAGRELTGAGAETLAAEYLAGGYFAGDTDISAAELLRRSGFSLAGGDGGRGVSIWGSGGYISADGDHDGVDYDGDTSAFHIGGDTQWRDGLVGIAVSQSSGDIDFTVAADGMKSTLETSVTSVHPYLSRRINGSQLWLTAGYGSGDAELKEPGTVIKTDVTITTAAFGIAHARGDLFTAGINAQYNRAKLDAATGGGKTLPATTADTIRITANAETGWTHGAWRPFLNFALRHDSGDGDTGGGADLGGGLEWQAPTVLVRLAGTTHIQGQAADEQRATLTIRKSTGNFDLTLNLAADDAGVDIARLLTGEWRF